MNALGSIDWVGLLPAVVERLLGEPNKPLSTKFVLAFGRHGSLKVDLRRGTWFDHELKRGGGTLDLIIFRTGRSVSGALDWLQEQGLIAKATPRPEPRPTSLKIKEEPPPASAPPFRVVASWPYVDENGHLLFEVERRENGERGTDGKAVKSYWQRRPDGAGGWTYNVKGVRQVPYRLPEVVEAIATGKTIFVVEGEKCADACWSRGIPATTGAMGAGKWPTELSPHFDEADVIIIPDNDRPGWDHALLVAQELKGHAASALVLRLPGLPEKGDIVDWFDAGYDAANLYDIATDAVELGDILEGAMSPPPFETQATGTAVATVTTTPALIRATPYQWTDATLIPPRVWLYERHIIRGFFSLDIGPGAVGKSCNTIVEMLSLAIGRNLFTGRPIRPARVWYWNGEDPLDELHRRVQAAALHYRITKADLGDRLHIDSGRKMPIVVAYANHGSLVIAEPVVEAVTKAIRDCGIDCFSIDPFVRCHRLSENDNTAINAVAEQWAAIAEATNAAIIASHHIRKGNGSGEVTVDDARGGGSLTAGARSVRTLQRMTAAEAEKAGIPASERKFYFRVDSGDKANMAPPVEVATWRRLVSVGLGNQTDQLPADEVGVATAWQWPDAFAGVSVADLDKVRARLAKGTGRQDPRATDWAGYVVAEVLDLDGSDRAAKAKISSMLQTWIRNRELVVVRRADRHGDDRSFIVPTGFEEPSAV